MIISARLRLARFALRAAMPLLAAATAAVAAEGPVSDWVGGYNSRVRLLAGIDSTQSGYRLVAGVEIETKPDWKTYWRNPGDAGVPPAFDWSKSTNVAKATVLYPAPRRLVDKSGVTIGYLGRVMFPVLITPSDPSKPVSLKLAVDYGVCKEICVPAQAELTLDIAAGAAVPLPSGLAAALDSVPRAQGKERPGDPVVKSVAIELTSIPPRIVLEVALPVGVEARSIDAFLVAEDGGFMPLPAREAGAAAGILRLVVDLSKDVDIKDLRGKTAFATITGPDGASEVAIVIK
ncbi:MAG: protein-disulfide reductase DsbD domain-containing protein [Hyphomicrobium sp.]